MTLDQSDMVPVAEGLFTGPPADPRLIGSECGQCSAVTFPRQKSCPRCASVDVSDRLLAQRGTLWTWTLQCFPPKSPPYVPRAGDEFEPYAVGYVELPGEVRVEGLLTESDPDRLSIGLPMELTLIPAPGSETSGAMTFAFRPVEAP